MELPCNPAIPLLVIYPKKPGTLIKKKICTVMCIAALFTRAKIWKQPKCLSVKEWIKRLWYIETMECYLAIKMKEILPFATTSWMDLQNVILSEISQPEKGKDHMISLICGI